MVKVIRHDFEKANKFLSEFDGKKSRLWSFSTNFNVIEILLFSNESDDNLFVVMPDCKYFSGEINISNVELRLFEKEGGIFELNDSNSDFKIIFESGFVLKRGIYEDFFDPNHYEVDLESFFKNTMPEE